MTNVDVPDNNAGDMISRQAAIDAFKKELTVGESKGNYVTICSAVGYEGAKQILERLPSAERKGKWINHRNDDGHNIADCSECGSAIQWFDDDERPRFCCMCGSRMEGEKNEKMDS